jgi:hypothetical protein
VRLRPGGHAFLGAAQPTLLALDGTGIRGVVYSPVQSLRTSALLRWKVVQHQLLLWAGTTAAIYLLFGFIEKGVLKPEAAGPTATILIALSIYMAGITFDWRLIVISLLLSAMAVGAIFFDRVILIVLGCLLILLVAFVLLRPVIKGWRTAATPDSTDTPAAGPQGTPPHDP